MLHSLNRQYHSRINQRPVVQGLVNISMLILWTQHLLLKTLPDLHPKHLFLITRVKNLSATSYLFYYFICFIAIWLWTFNKNRGNGNDRFLIATILLLIEFFFFFWFRFYTCNIVKEHSRNKPLPGYTFPIERIFFVTTSKILAQCSTFWAFIIKYYFVLKYSKQ